VRQLVRERERQEGPGPRPGYELCFERRQTFVERQHRGTVIVWPHEREWDVSRQGKIMWFLHPGAYKDTCASRTGTSWCRRSRYMLKCRGSFPGESCQQLSLVRRNNVLWTAVPRATRGHY
jgi:hypothetical protein